MIQLPIPSILPPTANPRHLSITNEHFTPLNIVEAARATMGGIDVDPATTVLANEHRIKAEFIHTQEDNGFDKKWFGRVFLNPPGGKCDQFGVTVTRENGEWVRSIQDGYLGALTVKSSQKSWWRKLAYQWMSDYVTQAIFVSFSIELFQTSQVETDKESRFLPLDFAFCIPKVRTKYDREIENIELGEVGVEYVYGENPPHASAIIYLPETKKNDGWASARAGCERFRQQFSSIGKVVVPEKMPGEW